jgi:hypothetical protein
MLSHRGMDRRTPRQAACFPQLASLQWHPKLATPPPTPPSFGLRSEHTDTVPQLSRMAVIGALASARGSLATRRYWRKAGRDQDRTANSARCRRRIRRPACAAGGQLRRAQESAGPPAGAGLHRSNLEEGWRLSTAASVA